MSDPTENFNPNDIEESEDDGTTRLDGLDAPDEAEVEDPDDVEAGL